MEFDGIDLEDLANSDGAVLEVNTDKSNKSKAAEKDDDGLPPSIKDIKDEDIDDPEALDLDLIAGVAVEDLEDSEEEVDDKNIKDPSDKTVANSSSQNTFTSLASALFEDGSLTTLTDEDKASVKDAASLLALINRQIKENEFSNLNDNQKQYLEALATGVPHEAYAQTKANAAQYEKISDENITARPDLGKELIKRSFLVKGFDLVKATKYAELAANGDDFQREAVEARDALVAFENNRLLEEINARKQEQQELQVEAEKALSKLKSTVTETSEVIPGIKINSATRDKIFQSMTTPTKVKDEVPLNEVMEKYESDMGYKMRLHALDVITKGFTDFSKFTKTAQSSAAKKLEEQISNGFATTGTSMKAGGVVSASQTEIKNALDFLKL